MEHPDWMSPEMAEELGMGIQDDERLEKVVKLVSALVGSEKPLKKCYILGKACAMSLADVAKKDKAVGFAMLQATNTLLTQGFTIGLREEGDKH